MILIFTLIRLLTIISLIPIRGTLGWLVGATLGGKEAEVIINSINLFSFQ